MTGARSMLRVGTALVVISLLLGGEFAHAASVGEPVFASPHYGEKQMPALTPVQGSAERGSEIKLIIDGVHVGVVPLTSSSDGTASFTFTPYEPLAPGYHYAEVIAHDPTGQKYEKRSLWWWFHVRDTLPAPVVLKTIERPGNRLTVAGVVKKGFRVKVYVDGTFALVSDVSTGAAETQGFALTLSALSVGTHTITVAAVAPDGREGSPSEPSTVVMAGIAASTVLPPASPKAAGTASAVPPAPSPASSAENATGNAPTGPPAPNFPSVPPPETGAIPLDDTTVPSVAVVPEIDDGASVLPAPAVDGPSATAGTSRGQILALVMLGILLVVLILWYATRHDEGGPQHRTPSHEASSSPSPPPSPLQPLPLQEIPPPGGLAHTADEEGIPLPPPPPPPAPNFASRAG